MRSMDHLGRPIPDRLRGAALVMLVLTLPVILMPIGIALGASLSRGIGLSIGGQAALAITPAMLPWLAPLSAATFVSALFVYFGRGLRPGLAIALGWLLGTLLMAQSLAVVAGVVAYAIHTGTRRLEAAGRAG
jgi:hypothetical protein